MSTDFLEDLEIEGTDAPMILLLGQTGAGKSHFINTLKPGSVKESAHLISCK
jgi:predicted GTPase